MTGLENDRLRQIKLPDACKLFGQYGEINTAQASE